MICIALLSKSNGWLDNGFFIFANWVNLNISPQWVKSLDIMNKLPGAVINGFNILAIFSSLSSFKDPTRIGIIFGFWSPKTYRIRGYCISRECSLSSTYSGMYWNNDLCSLTNEWQISSLTLILPKGVMTSEAWLTIQAANGILWHVPRM